MNIKKLVMPFFKIMPAGVKELYYQKVNQFQNKKIIKDWERSGRPSPPPHLIKQLTIDSYRIKFGYDTLIETGTFFGEMVNAQLNNFKAIYSIELSKDLWQKAVQRFKDKAHVTILQGDSGTVLKDLVSGLNDSCIFWLDGHYSEGITARGEKDCPIYEELNAIFVSPLKHLLLIDDARSFNGTNDYPSTEELSKIISLNRPGSNIEVKDDIIRIDLKELTNQA